MTLVSSPTNPIAGNQVWLNSTTWIPYSSQNLFYEPIPFDFLYTAETQPQVIVTVNGTEAICASLNCNYNYVTPNASITGFSLSGTTLTITGQQFTSPIRQIMFSNIACTNPTIVNTQTITCTVIAVAGNWQPIVIDGNGLIPVNTASVINVPLIVTSLSPNTLLNPFGGTILTITGSNFPQSTTDGTNLTISFSDGTTCELMSTSSTQMVCDPDQFTTGLTSATFNVTVNGVTDTS